jgi:hypothetical protein
VNARRILALGALAVLAVPCASAQAGVRIGVGIGFPFCWPCCYPAYVAPAPVYYAPYPYYVVPAPVAVQSAPAPAPVQAAPKPVVAAPPQPVTATPALTPVSTSNAAPEEVMASVKMLSDPDEKVRFQAVTQLGRLKSAGAVDPLAATLTGDRSAAVREAAARALGLICDPRALPALQRAVLADSDHDVRRTAQFTVEIIQSR